MAGRKLGRPRAPGSMRAKIMIRVSKEEKLRLERIAWKNKRHLSTWVRERLEEVTA